VYRFALFGSDGRQPKGHRLQGTLFSIMSLVLKRPYCRTQVGADVRRRSG